MKRSSVGRAAMMAVLGFGCLGVARTASAEVLVSVEGTSQGKFVGESTRKEQGGKFDAHSISYEVKSPRDVATGQASGRRQHGPICITKTVGGASPQLFQALVSNEALKSVLFEFLQTNQTTGKEEIFHTVRLSNAVLSSYRLLPTSTGGATSAKHNVSSSMLVFEEVCFSFQGIEVQNKIAKTTATDGTVTAALKRK